MMIGPQREQLAAGEYWAKVCFTQDSSDLRALVALNLDLTVLHRASRAAGLLHGLGKLFLFRQTDADKILNYRHRLAAASSFLADYVHPATVFPRRFRFCLWLRVRR